MSEVWAVFYHGDKELAAYTIRGTSTGERDETIALLSYEKGIPAEEIRVEYEVRGGKEKGTKRDHCVMCIEYRIAGYEPEMVALFDGRDLTEKEAIRMIQSDQQSSKMVTMTKDQYMTVFRSLKDRPKI